MPNFSEFALNENDLEIIRSVTSEDGSVNWGSPFLSDIKIRIKTLHRELQHEACCYCRRSFIGEFPLVIDIEHVLPKSKFRDFCFSDFNLTVACKRCNLAIKKARIDFLTIDDIVLVKENATNKSIYRFIHPNLDEYIDNLGFISATVDNNRIVKYLSANATDKGIFTYQYFRLNELEIEQFDSLQGNAINIQSDRARALLNLLGLD